METCGRCETVDVRRRLCIAVMGVLVLGAAACGGGEGPRRTVAGTSDAPTGSEPDVAALWAIEDPVIGVESPRPFLPDPPTGGQVRVTGIDLPRTDEATTTVERLGDPTSAAETLYADPAAPDPARGRALMVGRTTMTDIGGELVAGLEGEEVTVAGRTGRLYEMAADTVAVVWGLELGPEISCGCTQSGFVAGRHIGRTEVLAAAEAATVSASRPSLSSQHRPGLEALGTAPYNQDDGGSTGVSPMSLHASVGGTRLSASVLAADPRLAVHSAFWAPDGEVVVSRWRTPQIAVPVEGAVVIVGPDRWTDDERASHDAFTRAANALVDSLRPATMDEVQAARAEIVRAVPLDPCDAVEDPHDQVNLTGVTGVAGDTRWTVGIAYADGSLSTCEDIAEGGATSSGAGGGGGPEQLDLRTPVELIGGSNTGTGTRWYRVAIGHVTTDAARVEVTVAGSAPVDAVLADDGPAPGRRWFATVVETRAMDPNGQVVVVARTADGTELGRAHRS